MKNVLSIVRALRLLLFMIAATFCIGIWLITPEQIAAISIIYPSELSSYGHISKFIGKHLLMIDTIVSRVVLSAVVITGWATGAFALFLIREAASMAHEEAPSAKRR